MLKQLKRIIPKAKIIHSQNYFAKKKKNYHSHQMCKQKLQGR